MERPLAVHVHVLHRESMQPSRSQPVDVGAALSSSHLLREPSARQASARQPDSSALTARQARAELQPVEIAQPHSFCPPELQQARQQTENARTLQNPTRTRNLCLHCMCRCVRKLTSEKLSCPRVRQAGVLAPSNAARTFHAAALEDTPSPKPNRTRDPGKSSELWFFQVFF